MNVLARFLPTSLPPKLTVVLCLLPILLGSCSQPNSKNPTNSDSQANLPNVVTTSTILTDLAETVGGDAIQLQGILEPGTDPHIYEPVPRDSIAFEKADLIFYNGYNLEPNLIKLINAAGVNARHVAVGESVPPLQVEAEGEQDLEPDPHVWGNAKKTITMVKTIRDELVKLSPEDRQAFAENADELIAELERLHQWIQQQIATIPEPDRQLITTHDAFEYYAHAYGLEVTGTLIGISTEEQPSAKTVQQLVEAVKRTDAPAIFAETTINPQLIQTVASEAGVKLAEPELYSDSIGPQGSSADSYIKMMVQNTKTITENLGGEYEPFR